MHISILFCTFALEFKPHTRSVNNERIYNRHLRQVHFIEAVNKLLKKKSSSHQNFKNLCAIAAESAAPQFYVTPVQALNKYNRYVRTGVINVSSEVTRNMYKCIFDRYAEALNNNNGTDFKYAIMERVLESAAPSFFIEPKAAPLFYYRAMAYKRSLARK